jgi:hypothetical protein
MYEEGLPNTVYEEMRKYLTIHEEAVSHILLCNWSILNFLINQENLIFFFISVVTTDQYGTSFSDRFREG